MNTVVVPNAGVVILQEINTFLEDTLELHEGEVRSAQWKLERETECLEMQVARATQGTPRYPKVPLAGLLSRKSWLNWPVPRYGLESSQRKIGF